MSSSRSERLLTELGMRYQLRPEFLDKLKAPVDIILSSEIPDDRRTELLELLAETCERDIAIRREGERLRSALTDLFQSLTDLNRKLRGLGGGPEVGPA